MRHSVAHVDGVPKLFGSHHGTSESSWCFGPTAVAPVSVRTRTRLNGPAAARGAPPSLLMGIMAKVFEILGGVPKLYGSHRDISERFW